MKKPAICAILNQDDGRGVLCLFPDGISGIKIRVDEVFYGNNLNELFVDLSSCINADF